VAAGWSEEVVAGVAAQDCSAVVEPALESEPSAEVTRMRAPRPRNTETLSAPATARDLAAAWRRLPAIMDLLVVADVDEVEGGARR